MLLARQREKLHVPFWRRLFEASAPNVYQELVVVDLGTFLVLLYRPADGKSYEMPHGGTVLEADAHVVLITLSGDAGLVSRFCGKE